MLHYRCQLLENWSISCGHATDSEKRSDAIQNSLSREALRTPERSKHPDRTPEGPQGRGGRGELDNTGDTVTFTLLLLECSSGVKVTLDEHLEGCGPLLLPEAPLPPPAPSFAAEGGTEDPEAPDDPEEPVVAPLDRLPPVDALLTDAASMLAVLAHRGRHSAPAGRGGSQANALDTVATVM